MYGIGIVWCQEFVIKVQMFGGNFVNDSVVVV